MPLAAMPQQQTLVHAATLLLILLLDAVLIAVRLANTLTETAYNANPAMASVLAAVDPRRRDA